MIIDDPEYRRKILTRLNRGESRHSVVRTVFYGKKGELHQAYREGQEDQLGALGLVVNAIVLWNTRYMVKAIEELRKTGIAISDDAIPRLAPLGSDHINIVGRYSFNLPTEIAHGSLRTLSTLKNE
jgi:hypothetical protein